MLRIKRLLRPTQQSLSWKAALPVLGLTAALLAGCAQVPTTPAVRTAAHVRFDSCAKPEYPQQSLRDKQTGAVVLGFLVDTNGKVVDSRVDRSSGYAALDEAARGSIASCTFTPAQENGVAVQAWAPVRYIWSLT